MAGVRWNSPPASPLRSPTTLYSSSLDSPSSQRFNFGKSWDDSRTFPLLRDIVVVKNTVVQWGPISFYTVYWSAFYLLDSYPPFLAAPISPRPLRIPGATVSGIELPIPPWVRKEFASGWLNHIPLVYLTDAYCCESASDDILSSPRPSNRKEISLTFAEWKQSWSRLLSLIHSYLPQEYEPWKTHLVRVLGAEKVTEEWDIWLVYDIEVRRCACCHPLDPAIFHSAIWNDVRSRAGPRSVAPAPQVKKSQSVADIREARRRVKRQLEEVVLQAKRIKPIVPNGYPWAALLINSLQSLT